EDGIRDFHVTGVQTCALPISGSGISYYFQIYMIANSPTSIVYYAITVQVNVFYIARPPCSIVFSLIRHCLSSCLNNTICLKTPRSEERRVGKEYRAMRYQYHT